ncbi:MAG: 3-hydroxyacyl-CoA dehydrogenase [Spirochaetes bacterium]|nr:MAG: 3-hydroxyacyl-CoA dehydrogenase [Spirochaetota bacterium]
MNIDDVKKVLIIGAGTMGQQIGVTCAMAGYEVAIYDIKEEALATATKRIGKLLDGFVAFKKITREEADAALGRIWTTTDPALAAKGAHLVSESVPENPDIKKKIFAQFNELCPPETVFTTNSSTLLPSMIAAATGRPDKFLAYHFHDIRMTNVVDVMPHKGTSPEAVELVRRFALKTGQAPIVLAKEHSGYVFNAMIGAVFFSAQSLASNGVAAVEDIDRAWMGVTHMPFGPFGMMDSVGLETVWHITHYWAERHKDPQAKKNADFVKDWVDRGRLGQKTGGGFYEYPDPAFGKPGFLSGGKKE